MFTPQTVKDRIGQHYIIRLRNQGQLSLSVQPEKFHNSQVSFQFVTRLQAPFGVWQSLASSNSFFSLKRWQNSNPSLSIEHYIAESLAQGSVEVYKTLSPFEVNKNRNQSRFKDGAGNALQLHPASSLLLSNGLKKKTIDNEQQASQFVDALDLQPEALQQLHSTLNLSPSAQSAGSSVLKSDIASALVSSAVVITIEPEHKPQKAVEFIEYANKLSLVPPARPESNPKIINQAWSISDCNIIDEYK